MITLFTMRTRLCQKAGCLWSRAPWTCLSLELLSGSKNALEDPSSILLSESFAEAIFGAEDPMGKTLMLDHESELQVAGVYVDLPSNSSYADMAFMAPWELYLSWMPERIHWGNSWFQCIVQIAGHADMAEVSALIKDAKLNQVGEDQAKYQPELFLHPMADWHLRSDFKGGLSIGGRIQYVWLFGLIGLFVLMLACINFMNLSTAHSEKRAKEVGIRKALGSHRSQLMGQFFTESILISLLALGLSLLGAYLMLPYFNEVADKAINLPWQQPVFWLLGLGFCLLTGILAGSYPALYLSSFQAVQVLKGRLQMGPMATLPRKTLVVTQFVVSVSLIIGTMMVFKQIQFAKNRPLGYEQDHLIYCRIQHDQIHQHYDAFRNELLQSGVVEAVSKSASRITRTGTTNSGFQWEGKDPDMQEEFVTVGISHAFGETIEWNLKAGRDFSRAFATDSFGFVINEAAAAYMGMEKPVGQLGTLGSG